MEIEIIEKVPTSFIVVLPKTDNPNFTGTDFYDIIKIDNRIILKSYPLNLENSVE